MSARPYLKLYISDYLGDTTHLSTEEHGAYLLLLMAAWNAGGRLPMDPDKLARIARCTPRRWATLADSVLPYFHESDGDFVQKRLEKELREATKNSEQSRAAGRASAEAKLLKSNKRTSTDVTTKRQRKGQRIANETLTPIDHRLESIGHRPESNDLESIPPTTRELGVPADILRMDPAKRGWAACCRYLEKFTTADRTKAGKFVGKIKQDNGLEDADLFELGSALWQRPDPKGAQAFMVAKARELKTDPAYREKFDDDAGSSSAEDPDAWYDLRAQREALEDWNGDEYFWKRDYGYPPGSPLCRLDPDLLVEFGYPIPPWRIKLAAAKAAGEI